MNDLDLNLVPPTAGSAYWRCVESKVESERLFYSRFILSPLKVGQANTIGLVMRRALLGEIKGTCITCAKFGSITHEYSTMDGIQESVHDILINSKEIVLKSKSSEAQKAFISIVGPRRVTAQDIELPTSVEVIDPMQHIATITKKVKLNIELKIEKDSGYRKQNIVEYKDGNFTVDAVFTPIRSVNYSIHCFESHDKSIMKEMLLCEIWSNGSITPEEAIYEASRSSINLFLPFLQAEKEKEDFKGEDIHESNALHPSVSIVVDQMAKKVTFQHIFIEQLELSPKAYNFLKKINVHTISDLLDYSQDDLMKMKNFGKKSVEQILEALQKRFGIRLQ
uniref:RNA polymerase alpha subunit n=1 Tax=Huperzia arctica TaxID=669708 RepID=UPI0023D8B7A3|nr:RNA polymerase alpha subunit [Huperzia arctica]WDR47045.1 RNA polymerase alpha subunit [Huperzia arctica]